jgi:hypothetical protein
MSRLSVSSALTRLGRYVDVYQKSSAGGRDGFGQQDIDWQFAEQMLAARSYQNRNTTRDDPSGTLHRDRPVFFFSPDADITANSRIEYEGAWYDLDATTEHRTHTVAVGIEVVDEDFDP